MDEDSCFSWVISAVSQDEVSNFLLVMSAVYHRRCQLFLMDDVSCISWMMSAVSHGLSQLFPIGDVSCIS